MFGANGFGTIRFGESPGVRSPILLSGRSVQDTGTALLRTVAGRCPASSTTTAGSVAARALRTVPIRSLSEQARLASGCGVNSGTALFGWGWGKSVGEGAVKASRGLLSSQSPLSIAAIHPTATTVLAGRSSELPLVSGTAMQAGRGLGIMGWGQEEGRAEMAMYRVLASGQGVTPLGTIRLLAATTLASGSRMQTASWSDFSFAGLVVRVVQRSDSKARAVAVKYALGRASAQTNTLPTRLIVPTILSGLSVTWGWSAGGVQGAGLLILNIQSASQSSRLRAERRARSHSMDGTNSRELRIGIERRTKIAGWEEGRSRVWIVGRSLAVRTLQEGREAGGLPTGRSLKGRGANTSGRNAGLTIERTVRGESKSAATHRIAVFASAVLAGQSLQSVELRTLMGRLRTLGTIEREWLYGFGRFAVIPDLRNDRVVVIFAEGRRVVIPRQSEL